MTFSRREFSKMMLGAAALGLVDTAGASRVFAQSKRAMRWLAAQTASGEGLWTNLKVEGSLPKGLNGTLFRTAPGMSESFGTRFNHLFDGDAYLSAWKFESGEVSLRAKFLETPQRLEEIEAKTMLYGEFGTSRPQSNITRKFDGKNTPSVNVIDWRGKLLGLSEGGLPTVINPETFAYEGVTDFDSVVPQILTFTAHPTIDAKTGDMFAYGFEKRPPGTLRIYQIERKTGKANELHSMPMDGFYMVHDSILTENYFILLIPSVAYDMRAVMSGKHLGEAMTYLDSKPTRMIAFPRNKDGGNAKPITLELPPQIIFHFGNAFETKDGKITFEVITTQNKKLIEVIQSWKKNEFAKDANQISSWGILKRITVDLKSRKMVADDKYAEKVEFPRYDMRLTAQESRYLFATENGYEANANLTRIDLKKSTSIRAAAGKMRTYGEPVFVPKTETVDEERGWILVQGYDGDKNETFLEIRDAQTLGFKSRIWAAGQHFPLGFHGNFYESK